MPHAAPAFLVHQYLSPTQSNPHKRRRRSSAPPRPRPTSPSSAPSRPPPLSTSVCLRQTLPCHTAKVLTHTPTKQPPSSSTRSGRCSKRSIYLVRILRRFRKLHGLHGLIDGISGRVGGSERDGHGLCRRPSSSETISSHSRCTIFGAFAYHGQGRQYTQLRPWFGLCSGQPHSVTARH